MSAELKSRGPELLIDLIDKTAAVLLDAGLDKENAMKCAHAIGNHMRKEWGGQMLYFPKGLAADISARDLEMYKRFDGTNHEVLAKEYDLSVQWVYKVIKTIHSMEIAKRQADLFLETE